jgi:chitin synthase
MELVGTLVLPTAIAITLCLIIVSTIPGHEHDHAARAPRHRLVSLLIWNDILPAYAFWHFDDFSSADCWGP